jgi:LytS/YehU family sensor histidine kinase
MQNFLHLFSIILEIIQRLSLLAIAAYMAMRLDFLREVLQGAMRNWQNATLAALFFGVLAIIGTHSGIQIDMQNGGILNWRLSDTTKSLPIVSFRYPILMVAGLTCGPTSGLIAGLLAAIDRYYIVGGDRAVGASLASVLLGYGSGLIKNYWPYWSINIKYQIMIIVVLGPLFEKTIIILFSYPQAIAATLRAIQVTLLPSTLSNLIAGLLLLTVMKELERERLKLAAELQALQAQVEPHFLNGTLTAIKNLIYDNPNTAGNALAKLGRFFNNTREFALKNAITVEQELRLLQWYLDLQALTVPDKLSLQSHVSIEQACQGLYIPPRCIVTLVENCFIHAMHGKTGVFEINIRVHSTAKQLEICVVDNGCGIETKRLACLVQQPVSSQLGSGTALHQLNQSLQLAFNAGAKIRVESQLGQGTQVTLTLPKRGQAW